jgi:hypothetical protein
VAALLALGAFAERTRGHRAWLAAIPIVAVNFVAFYGQASFFRSHRHVQPGVIIPLAIADIMALALESIAVYLAWQAHLARKSHDSAFRLRLAAYTVALGIGALNYSHFCGPHWRPTAYAVAFALASAISPALWGIHSNRESRDDLKAQGLIEDHAARLGGARWAYHPFRCLIVMSRATWAGVTKPAEAIALYRSRRERKDENSRGAGTGARPVTAAGSAVPAREESPVSRNKTREPRAQAVRAARVPELAAARAAVEAEMATELAHSRQPWPSIRSLAGDSRLTGALATRRRAADRIVTLARTMSNGAGHGDQHRA